MNVASAVPDASVAESFPPFALVDGDPAAGVLIVCDHADNRLPPEYGDLGLPAGEFQRHIAYDPGAAAVSRGLARRLGAPAVLSTFSRLLIDPNRGEDDPTLIMRLSDGAVVPGNATVDARERARRIARYHAPYHAAIDAVIDRALAAGATPVVISIHSFTPVWRGAARSWHAGVLWDSDPRIALPLIAALRAEGDLVVGDNEPYSGALANDSMYRHASRRGLAHGLVEIRQDLIGGPADAEAWAERLARIVAGLNRLAGVHDVRHYGSRAGGLAVDGSGDSEGSDRMTSEANTTELEAAVFRRLVAHLRERSDVQNIDLMNLAGFCRNCLANWYREAAAETGHEMSRDAARELIYGMPYPEWQARYQREASADDLAAFEKNRPRE